MFALLVGYQYHSAAVVSDEPMPAEPDAVSLVEELRGQPGTRVPHAWVDDGGKRVSTLDLLGPGFTLFTGDDGAAWSDAAASVSKAIGVPVAAHALGPDTEWVTVTGLPPAGALLVRPDDFVGWRTDELVTYPEKELRQVLSSILGRNP